MKTASPIRLFLLAVVTGVLAADASAQQKPTLTPDDYGQWETLGRRVLSPDGEWLAVNISRVSDEDELRVHHTESDSVVVVPFGRNPHFSDDGAWLAYAIGISADEQEALTEQGEPVRNDMGLLDLGSGARETIEEIASFSFSGDGRHLALQRYKPEEKESAGVDAIVRDLAAGTSMSFGNVSALAWQDEGHLLAMAVDADGQVGNGVRLFDPVSGRIQSLDTDAAEYRELSWREEEADLAVLKTYTDEEHEDTAHVALAWLDLDDGAGTPLVLDPRESSAQLPGQRIVEHRAPAWADDGSILFLGVQDRIPVADAEDAEGDEAEDEAGEGEEGSEGEEGAAEAGDEEERAGVEIWHSLDVDPVPQQRVRERRLREQNHIGAWQLDDGRFLVLGGEHADQTRLLEGGRFVLNRDETPYDVKAMFDQQFYDLYAVDTRSGGESLVRERITLPADGSPGGRYVVWFEGEDYWSYDLSTGETSNITEGLGGEFVNLDLTPTRAQMPPFGVAGWTEDDQAVLINDRWDVWEVRSDGSGGRRLTPGAEGEVRYRAVQPEADADAFKSGEPVYYSTYGEWSKQAGFSRARPGRTPEALGIL